MTAAGYSELAAPLLDRAQMLAPGTTARRRRAVSPSSTNRLDDLRRKFDAEVGRGEWRSAAGTWNDLQIAIETSEFEYFVGMQVSDALTGFARAAAAAGEAREALRYWQAATNVDRTCCLQMLPELARNGLRAELTAFYESMSRHDRASWVPAVALAELNRP